MKRYVNSNKIKYELLGYVVDNSGYYKRVWLNTYAESPEKAISNFRSQIHTNKEYAGWDLVTDPKLMNLRQDTGPRSNRWPKLPDESKLID